MSETVDPLMRELLLWVASRPRSYADAMEVWQTACPRHTIWEDALIDGLIQVTNHGNPHGTEVTLTNRGRAVLDVTR
jgi:hypothetical protein